MAYGTLKCDKISYSDGSNPDITKDVSEIVDAAPLTSPDFVTDITLTAAAPVKFNQTDNTAAVSLKAPGTGVTSYTITLPATVGASGKVLKTTDGAGALEWGDDNATDATKLPLAGGTMTGTITFDASQTFDGVDVSTLPTLAADQSWTGAQRATPATLSSGSGGVPCNLSLGNNFNLTLDENSTLAQPSNQVPGQSGSIFITQDTGGNFTLAYHDDWKFAGGDTPKLSTAEGAVDRIDYIVAAVNKIHAVVSLDVKTGT